MGNIIARILLWLGPKGLEFGRYSIDYHYTRNFLYVMRNMGVERAQRHIPEFARRLIQQYDKDGAVSKRWVVQPWLVTWNGCLFPCYDFQHEGLIRCIVFNVFLVGFGSSVDNVLGDCLLVLLADCGSVVGVFLVVFAGCVQDTCGQDKWCPV